MTLDQSNAPSNSSILPPQEGDSQQAAEAMVQLSGTQSFYQTAEESMEIDPNYDPSDFLGMSNRQLATDTGGQPGAMDANQFAYQQGSAFDPNFQQFQQQPAQFENQQIMGNVGEVQLQEQPQQQPNAVLPPLQSLHKDLAISDSDDEQNNLQMDIFNNTNENDDNDDGGGLWF